MEADSTRLLETGSWEWALRVAYSQVPSVRGLGRAAEVEAERNSAGNHNMLRGDEQGDHNHEMTDADDSMLDVLWGRMADEPDPAFGAGLGDGSLAWLAADPTPFWHAQDSRKRSGAAIEWPARFTAESIDKALAEERSSRANARKDFRSECGSSLASGASTNNASPESSLASSPSSSCEVAAAGEVPHLYATRKDVDLGPEEAGQKLVEQADSSTHFSEPWMLKPSLADSARHALQA